MALPSKDDLNGLSFSKDGSPWVRVSSKDQDADGLAWSKDGSPFWFIEGVTSTDATDVFDCKVTIIRASTNQIDGKSVVKDSTTNLFDGLATVKDSTTDVFDGLSEIIDEGVNLFDGKAQVKDSVSNLFDGKADIGDIATDLIDGKAQIKDLDSDQFDGKAKVSDTTTNTFDGKAQVKDSDTDEFDGKASIYETAVDLIDGKVDIKDTIIALFDGKAVIKDSASDLFDAKAHIYETATDLIDGKAKIEDTTTDVFDGKAIIPIPKIDLFNGRAKVRSYNVLEYNANKGLQLDSIGGKVLDLGKKKISTWNDLGRPSAPRDGMFGFNFQSELLEVYNDTTWKEIGSPEILVGTETGQMAYWDETLQIWNYTEGGELKWDDTNKRLGIGTSTPTEKLEIDGNIFLNGDNDKILLGTGKDASIYYDGTNGNIKTDLVAPSDLHIDCGTDKTIVLNETVWEDVQFPIATGKVPAANYPDWEAFTTNTNAFAFAVNNYIDMQANEVPHSWKEGTAGSVHCHFANKTAQNTGSDRYVKFIVYISYADANEVWTETSVTDECIIPTGTSALTHFLCQLGDLALPNNVIGTQINVRIKRIAATGGTEYADNIYITQVGIHFENDTLGSRTVSTK